MNESEFTILRTVKQTEHYKIVVGIVPGDKVPQYLIFNKEYEVLEFAHNVLAYVFEAMDDLETKLQEYLAKDAKEAPVIQDDKPTTKWN